MCGHRDELLQKMNLLAGITLRSRHNEICRSVGTLPQLRMCSRSALIRNRNNTLWTLCGGPDSGENGSATLSFDPPGKELVLSNDAPRKFKLAIAGLPRRPAL
jgi:hypothetical protein